MILLPVYIKCHELCIIYLLSIYLGGAALHQTLLVMIYRLLLISRILQSRAYFKFLVVELATQAALSAPQIVLLICY